MCSLPGPLLASPFLREAGYAFAAFLSVPFEPYVAQLNIHPTFIYQC